MDAAPVQADHRFPCSKCGGDLRFDPASGDLVCDHCGNREPLRQAHSGERIREIDIRAGLVAGLPETEMETARWSRCPNCGAQVEFDPAVHAMECPFCATPVVADTGDTRQIKPKGVAPFAIPERDARAAMTVWLGSLWFAPNGLMDYARKGRAMQGIYVPFWTFDADTTSDYTGRRGVAYTDTETVTVRDAQGRSHTERRNVTRIRWTPASGRVARFFDDVLVLASRSLPQGHTDALTPWDLSRLAPYRPEYLAGFRAEGYTVPLDEGLKEARAWMDRMIERDVRFDIGGDRQEIHNIATQVSGVTFKHVLLPVWLAAYKFRGKSYRFVVNGQTGKVKGERPWSAVKLLFFGLLVAGATAVAIYVADRNGVFDNIRTDSGGSGIQTGN